MTAGLEWGTGNLNQPILIVHAICGLKISTARWSEHMSSMVCYMGFEGCVVEFWGLLPLILFFNMSTGWFGRFALSTECYRTRKLDNKDLNWPRCSAQVTESLALTDGGFCQKQTLYILDYVTFVSL